MFARTSSSIKLDSKFWNDLRAKNFNSSIASLCFDAASIASNSEILVLYKSFTNSSSEIRVRRSSEDETEEYVLCSDVETLFLFLELSDGIIIGDIALLFVCILPFIVKFLIGGSFSLVFDINCDEELFNEYCGPKLGDKID
ncbi:hypothetical protein OGAPHI_001965 [Ogataea philodendri]|uniref:Uncharacterized protein n=1 Tax=Ogataea philodendri TaxID=1378263 RepID=A0A9P8T7Q6_9ASCO|nr:uncharacterized protein OGAPHI_001965 [Ogataea philodendri]KAH3668211.1 hypothetical protein OGAPHI_001965 [Ogataea philodendri]